VNRKILQDFDAVEEHWGQHQDTTSEIEALEAEELRRAEEEYAAQQAMEQERVAKEEEQRKWRADEERPEKQAERKKAEKEAARKKKEEEEAAARQKADLEPASTHLDWVERGQVHREPGTCAPCLQRRMNNTYQKAEPGGGRPGSGGRADGNGKPDEQKHWNVLLQTRHFVCVYTPCLYTRYT
jgi:hypothetical protein